MPSGSLWSSRHDGTAMALPPEIFPLSPNELPLENRRRLMAFGRLEATHAVFV
jgi:hypothetical protein